VRAMCLNDAHIYCEYDQVKEEFAKVMDLYKYYYDYLRLGNFRVRLSLHDSESDKYVKDEEEWQFSEDIVREILNENKIDFIEERGEAAFYGPKVDIQIKNLLGREETVSTCQLDFVMAKRFDLWYSAKDGTMKQPYILHRAPLSTHERMISFLIEFWGGAFPTWMAPNQVMLIPVNEGVVDYAMEMKQKMTELGIRCDIDVSDDSFNKKIRKAVTKKTPNMWIIGENEKAEGTITWRRYCVQDQIKMSADAAIDKIVHLRTNRIMDNFADVQI
ncbi:MAG: hypothetical protein KA747_06785, partial [Ignavibacteriaceae bacterium]|nr:hypothetical protein [Ignavibacteriaceae bacterium]